MNQGQVKDWRDLCQAAAIEQDPHKLMTLVAELVKALDSRHKKAEAAAESSNDCGQSSLPRRCAVEDRSDTTCESAISL